MMKQKHIDMWVSVCKDISKVSNCPRGKFAALVIDEDSNTLLASGYNGYLRGGTPLCGGETCARDAKGIKSGENIEIGCIHAEMNALINCARETVSSRGKVLFLNGEPCLMCAKFIIQAGIRKVYIVGGVYRTNGVEVLKENKVEVVYIED
jgi:dCMP deaminase